MTPSPALFGPPPAIGLLWLQEAGFLQESLSDAVRTRFSSRSDNTYAESDGSPAMIRTQIQLTERQSSALKRFAADEGVSMASLVRLAVDRLLAERGATGGAERRRRALAVVGRFRSGLGDLAEEHDRHLADLAAGEPAG